MHKHSYRALPLAIAALIVAMFAPMGAFAAAPTRALTQYHQCVVDATSSTFATTAYADLAAATCSVTPARDPNRTEAPGTPAVVSYIQVSLTLNMSKATATTGTCAVYVNGAVLAKTAQVQNFLATTNQNVSAVWRLPNTTSGVQTVKVQCKSADTNILTVSAGHMIVETIE